MGGLLQLIFFRQKYFAKIKILRRLHKTGYIGQEVNNKTQKYILSMPKISYNCYKTEKISPAYLGEKCSLKVLKHV